MNDAVVGVKLLEFHRILNTNTPACIDARLHTPMHFSENQIESYNVRVATHVCHACMYSIAVAFRLCLANAKLSPQCQFAKNRVRIRS